MWRRKREKEKKFCGLFVCFLTLKLQHTTRRQSLSGWSINFLSPLPTSSTSSHLFPLLSNIPLYIFFLVLHNVIDRPQHHPAQPISCLLTQKWVFSRRRRCTESRSPLSCFSLQSVLFFSLLMWEDKNLGHQMPWSAVSHVNRLSVDH